MIVMVFDCIGYLQFRRDNPGYVPDGNERDLDRFTTCYCLHDVNDVVEQIKIHEANGNFLQDNGDSWSVSNSGYNIFYTPNMHWETQRFLKAMDAAGFKSVMDWHGGDHLISARVEGHASSQKINPKRMKTGADR